MEDFRTTLYQKYQSTFKKHINKSDQEFSESDYQYFKFKYLPLIKSYDSNSSILDLGCGTGIMMNYLRKSGFNNVEGVDISEEQVDVAKKLGLNASVCEAALFLDKCHKYDLIFILDFIEHFTKEEILSLIAKIKNVLKPGGALIIRTPNGNGIYPNKIIYGDLTHLTIFNSNSLTQLLKLFEFDKIEFFETGPVPKNLKGFVGFILWQFEKYIFNLLRYIEVRDTEKYLTREFICKAIKREI